MGAMVGGPPITVDREANFPQYIQEEIGTDRFFSLLAVYQTTTFENQNFSEITWKPSTSARCCIQK